MPLSLSWSMSTYWLENQCMHSILAPHESEKIEGTNTSVAQVPEKLKGLAAIKAHGSSRPRLHFSQMHVWSGFCMSGTGLSRVHNHPEKLKTLPLFCR